MIAASLKSINKFLIIFLIYLHPLIANEQAELWDFFKIEKLSKENEQPPKPTQTIRIKGFLYKTENMDLILAAEPNLKSCCVGSSSKREKQLLIFGDIAHEEKQSHVITLEGNLYIDRKHPFPLQLQNAVIIQETDNPYPKLAIAGIAVILISIGLFKYFSRKTQIIR